MIDQEWFGIGGLLRNAALLYYKYLSMKRNARGEVFGL